MIARCRTAAQNNDETLHTAVFVHRSIVPGSADEVFNWHERPEAFRTLLPFSRWLRIERRTGGVRDGGRIAFSVRFGPLRVLWEARHYGYIRGMQFCDEQVRGPFRKWRHTHRIYPMSDRQSLYEDRVEYELPGGALARWLSDGLFRRLLAFVFARRHRIIRMHFSGFHRPAASSANAW